MLYRLFNRCGRRGWRAAFCGRGNCFGGWIVAGLLLAASKRGFAEDTLRISLQQVVELAKERSIAARQAATVKETKYWQWRVYRSNYQPQLALNGTFPAYSKTFTQVLQPDGTILFQPIYNNNSNLNLSFSQTIAATGGTIFGTTQLQRFDDFDRHNTLYNAVPFGIGYSQPLWQFNQLKWDNRIEPLKYDESRQAFVESMEQIAVTVTGYFFDLLLAQVNLQIAETNLGNTRSILRIADEKLKLGKISKNELLQLQLERLKAMKAAGIARRDVEIATLTLRSNTGLPGAGAVLLELPPAGIAMTVSAAKVLEEAYANRSDAIAFVRRLREASRDIALARGQSGLNASLTARLGYSNSATTFSKVYHDPQDQQLLEVDFSIPILDWGRSKSRIRTAQANEQFTRYSVEQDKQVFTQQIVTQVTLFEMMRDQVSLTA
ncbi:MAG TPA: TolC family protein, partial [Puia sp.]|nr:TolC family protein [Puia sp.]